MGWTKRRQITARMLKELGRVLCTFCRSTGLGHARVSRPVFCSGGGNALHVKCFLPFGRLAALTAVADPAARGRRSSLRQEAALAYVHSCARAIFFRFHAFIGASHDTAKKRSFTGQSCEDTRTDDRSQSGRAHARRAAERSGRKKAGGKEGGKVRQDGRAGTATGQAPALRSATPRCQVFVSFLKEACMSSRDTQKDALQGSFAIVIDASSAIGLELARCCAAAGFDLLIAADEPEIEAAAQQRQRAGEGAAGRPIDDGRRRPPVRRGRRAARRRAARQCRARVGPRLSGRGFHAGQAGTRHQRDRHALPAAQGCRRDARSRPRAHPHHGLHRGLHAGLVPGRLQRHQGLYRFVFLRAAQRAEGLRRHRDLPHAGADRHRILRARRRARHQGRPGQEGRPRQGCEDGLRGDARRRRRRGRGLEEQAAGAVANITPSSILAEQHRKMAEPGSGRS